MGVININTVANAQRTQIGAVQMAQAGDRSSQWRGLNKLGAGIASFGNSVGQGAEKIIQKMAYDEDQRLSNEAFTELSKSQTAYDYNTEKNTDGKVGTFSRKGTDLKTALEDSNGHLKSEFERICKEKGLNARASKMFEMKYQALATSNQGQIQQHQFKQGRADLVTSIKEAMDATDRAQQQAPDNGVLYDQEFAQNESLIQALGISRDTETERVDENGNTVKVKGAEYELMRRAFMDSLYTKAITREIDAVKNAKDMDAIIKRLGDPEAIKAYLKEDSNGVDSNGKVSRLGNSMREFQPSSKINNALVEYARTHKRKLQNEAWGKEREEYREAYAKRGEYEIKAWKAGDNITEIQKVRDELERDTNIPSSQEKQRVAGLQYCDRLLLAKQKADWSANPQNPKNVYASARATRFNSSQALEPLIRRKNALMREVMEGGYDESKHQAEREKLWKDYCDMDDKGAFTTEDQLKFLNGWQSENDEATREAMHFVEAQFPHDKNSPASGNNAKRTITSADGSASKTISEYEYDNLVQKLKIRLSTLPAECDRTAIAIGYVSKFKRDFLKDGFVGVSKHMSQYFIGGGNVGGIMLQSSANRAGQDARVRMGQMIDSQILALQAELDAGDDTDLGVDDNADYYDFNQTEQE